MTVQPFRASDVLAGQLRKPLLILAALTFVVFGNCLLNGFVGDDSVVIENNTFYESWRNVPKLFTKDYNSNYLKVFRMARSDKGSGSVAYRPVLSMTYFMDYAVWKKNPFGYHLTNVLIHLLNVLFVFFLVGKVVQDPRRGFWAAAIFAIHPVHAEAVSAIGYRADLLAALGVLVAGLGWFHYREGHRKALGWVAGGYVFAVFSKESAILLPLWLLAYDWYKGVSVKRSAVALLLTLPVTTIYLFLYFFVFRNSALSNNPALFDGLGVSSLLPILSQIWLIYLKFLFVPFTAAPIPGLYYPRPYFLFPPVVTFSALIVMALMLVWLFRPWAFRASRGKLFLFWSLIFFLPAAGFIPNPTPMACRYLYLPSVGLFAALAGVISWVLDSRAFKQVSTNLGRAIVGGIILMMAGTTFFNNAYWKNNFAMSFYLSQAYPDHYKTNAINAIMYFSVGMYQEAIVIYEKALNDSRFQDPEALYYLARSYMLTGRYKNAKPIIDWLEQDYSWYSRTYYVKAYLAFDENRLPDAKQNLMRAINMGAEFDDFLLWLDIAAQEHDEQAIPRIIAEARKKMLDPAAVKYFEEICGRAIQKMQNGKPNS